jgi:hypothetical protein
MTYAQEQLEHINQAAEANTKKGDKPTRKRNGKHMRGAKSAALEVMHKNLGLHMTIEEVTEQAKPHKSGTRFVRTQIGQGLSTLADDNLIRRVGAGVYVYNPTDNQAHQISMPDNRLFEAVGSLDDGTPVVRGEDGQLLVLQTLEAYYRSPTFQ